MKNLANVEQFYIQGIEIILDLSEDVFSPSKNGSFYADNIILKSNERIIITCIRPPDYTFQYIP